MMRRLIFGLVMALALAHPALAKPLVVLLADARGTVATDLLAPYAILAESGGRDLRWVTDGPITTTAGISAAEPASLNLLRELAGEATMRETARRLRLPPPDQRHRGDDFHLTARGAGLVVANRLAFWRHEDVAVPLSQGVDELAFGTAMDAWSRTYRSTAWAVGAPSAVSRHGLLIYRDRTLPARFDRKVGLPGADAMVATFDQIRVAYGAPTARFVALQFEHPYGAISAW